MSLDSKALGIPDRQRRLAPALCTTAPRALDHQLDEHAGRSPRSAIVSSDAAPPVDIPPGHVGPVVLPGTGRTVWWTGRVAIGLRHQPPAHSAPVPQSALWVQQLMLGPRRAAA